MKLISQVEMGMCNADFGTKLYLKFVRKGARKQFQNVAFYAIIQGQEYEYKG